MSGISFNFNDQSGKKQGIFLLILLIFLSIVLYFLLFKSENLPLINMNIKELPPEVHESGVEDGILRVAFGARISPEFTSRHYIGLLNFVGEKMGMKIRFSQKKTYSELNDQIRVREVDLAYVCSGPFIKGHDKFKMELLVVPVVHGKKTYQSYIIVNKKSKISTFEELRNKKFAFSDPDSNTGYMVPVFMLSEIGETPESFFSETFFTYSHDNSIIAVGEKQSDGAAVDSLVWEFFNKVNPSITLKTRIIKRSIHYGIPPFVVHPDLDKVVKERLRDIFLNLHKDPKARTLLNKIQIDRFERADVVMYESLIKMKRIIEKLKVNNVSEK